jgi:hypothetical protein
LRETRAGRLAKAAGAHWHHRCHRTLGRGSSPARSTATRSYLDLRDEFGAVDAYVDLHHMERCQQIEGDGDYVSVTLDYPPLGPEDSDKYTAWPLLDQDKSRRFARSTARARCCSRSAGSPTTSGRRRTGSSRRSSRRA